MTFISFGKGYRIGLQVGRVLQVDDMVCLQQSLSIATMADVSGIFIGFWKIILCNYLTSLVWIVKIVLVYILLKRSMALA